jgi:hypothetical protein
MRSPTAHPGPVQSIFGPDRKRVQFPHASRAGPSMPQLPTPASPRSPAAPAPASKANTPTTPTTQTQTSVLPSPRSPPCTTPPAAPTTTAKEPKARDTTPPSSASPDAAATSCSPCSATKPTTDPHPEPLDKILRDTPSQDQLKLRGIGSRPVRHRRCATGAARPAGSDALVRHRLEAESLEWCWL